MNCQRESEMLATSKDYWTGLGYELVTTKDGRIWRMKRGESQEGVPHTGNCSWYAATGGAGRSNQWKFGPTREAVLARLASECNPEHKAHFS